MAMLPAADALPSGTPRELDGELLSRALGCFASGSLLAAFGIACVIGVLRGPRGLGGLPAGVWAVGVLLAQVGLALHCPIGSPAHLWLGHASVGAVCILVMLGVRSWARSFGAR